MVCQIFILQHRYQNITVHHKYNKWLLCVAEQRHDMWPFMFAFILSK